MATEAQTSQTEVIKVLDKIKKEMFERKQLRAQNETNKQLGKMNKNLDAVSRAKQGAEPKDTVVKMPTVRDFVAGFARVSPIFTRDYSTWMKDTVNVGTAGNTELATINGQLTRLSDSLTAPKDDLNTEYLNLISDQLKAANDNSLERLKDEGGSFHDIRMTMERIGDGVMDLVDNGENATKQRDQQLIRLHSIENKIGRVGGHIVSTLKRIYEGDEKQREQDQMRRGEEGKEGGSHPVAGSVIPEDDDKKEDSSGIGAAVAAMLGLTALKGFLLAPFKSIGKVLGKFFGMFGKMGAGITELLGPFGKVLKFLKVGPLALISAIWDFGKGFFNAKEILGKASVTIVDRIRAGLTELVGGFGDLFDWVAKIFGFDTDAGKKVREFALAITEAPARWLNSIVDWISNDLFAGISKNTSLTDIPGKLADNLQTELMKLVNWIGDGIGSFVDDALKLVGDIGNDIKVGFAEKVKKPFINMVNAITNAMFDIVDKFISIIPDSLGGEAARKKMIDARQSMLMDQADDTANTPAPAPADPVNTPNPAKLSPIIPQGQTLPSGEDTAPSMADGLKNAYGGIGGGSLGGARPTVGAAANNVGQVQSLYDKGAATVVAPIQQNVNNAKQINNTTNYNSSSLEPTNNRDIGRALWDS